MGSQVASHFACILHCISGQHTAASILDSLRSEGADQENAEVQIDTTRNIDPTRVPLPEDSPSDWSLNVEKDDELSILNVRIIV